MYIFFTSSSVEKNHDNFGSLNLIILDTTFTGKMFLLAYWQMFICETFVTARALFFNLKN